MSLLQYVNWKRSPSANGNQNAALSPEIQAYSEKAGKWGMIAAGVTWAVTRNPLRAIAVLLAANPRPATLPAQYAWSQAELVSGERSYVVPEKGTLSRLARTRTILLEDSSLLFNAPVEEEIHCISAEDEDEDKLICLAASLMKKSSHPWKEEVYHKAKLTCRTIRTAFHVEETEQGMKGKVNDNWILIGGCKFLQDHGIDCASYELKAKRLVRKGNEVLFAGKLGTHKGECIGLITKHRESTPNENGLAAASFIEKGWHVGLLNNSLSINEAIISKAHLDTSWLSVEQGEVIERIAAMQQHGEDVLFVSSLEPSPVN
jgi:hypothetical protein